MDALSQRSASSRSRHSSRQKPEIDCIDDCGQSIGEETTRSMYTIKKIEEYVNFEMKKARGRELERELEEAMKRSADAGNRNSEGNPDCRSLFSAPTLDVDEASVEISLNESHRSYNYGDKNVSQLGMFLDKSKSCKVRTGSKRSSGSASKGKAPIKGDNRSIKSNTENAPPNGQFEPKACDESVAYHSVSTPKTMHSSGKTVSTCSTSGSSTSFREHEATLENAITKLQINESKSDSVFSNEGYDWETKLGKLSSMIDREKEKTTKLEELEKLLAEKQKRVRKEADKAKWKIKVDQLEELLEAKRSEKNKKLEKLARLLSELKLEKNNKQQIYAILQKRSEDGSKKSSSHSITRKVSHGSMRSSSHPADTQSIGGRSTSSKSKLSTSSFMSRISKSSKSSRKSKQSQ